MIGFQSGNPTPLLPTLSGGEMLIAVSESTVVTAGLQVSGGSVAIPPLGGRVGPGILQGDGEAVLSGPAGAMARSGQPFDVELLVDTVARTAQASITVGADTFDTAVTTAPAFELMQPDLAVQANSVMNNGAPYAQIATGHAARGSAYRQPRGLAKNSRSQASIAARSRAASVGCRAVTS